MELIDKDALVAEIKERIKTYNKGYANGDDSRADALEVLLHNIDTLEVKEVDLEKETTHYLLYEHCSPLNEIMHKADLKSEMQYHKDIENAFKAGFKLGMQVSNKAQKGEEV